MPPVDVEDVSRELKHLEADVRDGRRIMCGKIADVEAGVVEVKKELHGLVTRTEEREKNHNERHSDLKAQIQKLGETIQKQESATAAFNKDLLTAIQQNRPPTDPPASPTQNALNKTFADHLNALDWRWTLAVIVIVALLTGSMTISSGAADRLMDAVVPAPTAPASTAGPQGPGQ